MNRLVATVAVLALAVLTCGQAEGPSRIEGKLVGADGKVPPMAHVHLLALGDDLGATLKTVRVAADGSFRLEVPGQGYYDMLVTAVGHRPFRLPLVSDDGFHLTGVTVTPAPYQYKDPMEDVKIIGDWEQFSRHGAEPMTLLGDGMFAYERSVETDSLAYQLRDAEVSGRSINGTDSDHYVYDGGGDYISVIYVEGDTATVLFDPHQARITSSADLPAVGFRGNGGALAEAWEIQKRWLDETARRDSALQAYLEGGGTYEGFEYDLAGLREYLMGKMTLGEHPAARRYAAVTLAGLLDLGLELQSDEAMAIVDHVPVTDRMWAADPTAFPEVFRLAYGQDRMMGLFESDLDNVAEEKVRAAMLLELGLEAKATGDSTKQREIYDDLISNHPDVNVPYISYRIRSQLDPDLKITAGKPVPDFELALLNGAGTVSNTSMLGRYYLIDFWASWCGPCVNEMPNLHGAYERFKDRGFEILSISLDQTVEQIGVFRAGQWKMPWLHAFAEGMFESDIARRFEVSAIPKPVLVDPEGMIVAVGPELRGKKLEKTLAQYLGE
jgi:thiol-disulfide isomerase/thioredoxin